MAFQPSQRMSGACVGAVILGAAALWWLGRHLLPCHPDPAPGADARIDLIDAARLYSQRKHALLSQRFEHLQQQVRAMVQCVRQSCPDEVHDAVLRDTEHAIEELDQTAEHFVRPYDGVRAEEMKSVHRSVPESAGSAR